MNELEAKISHLTTIIENAYAMSGSSAMVDKLIHVAELNCMLTAYVKSIDRWKGFLDYIEPLGWHTPKKENLQ